MILKKPETNILEIVPRRLRFILQLLKIVSIALIPILTITYKLKNVKIVETINMTQI